MQTRHFLMLCYLTTQLHTMELPEPEKKEEPKTEIPSDIALIVEQRTKNLEKDIADKNTFLAMLKNDFTKKNLGPTNCCPYMAGLHWFASFLFWHNQTMQRGIRFFEIETLRKNLQQLETRIATVLGITKINDTLASIDIPDRLLPEFMSNPLFIPDKKYSQEEEAALLSLARDTQQDPLIRLIGYFYFIRQYILATKNALYQITQELAFFMNFYEVAEPLRKSKVVKKLVGIDWQLSVVHREFVQSITRLAEIKKMTMNKLITQAYGEYTFLEKISKESRAYSYFFPLQNKLYTIIYNELHNQIKQALQTDKKFPLIEFLQVVVFEHRSTGNIEYIQPKLLEHLKEQGFDPEVKTIIANSIPKLLPKELNFSIPPLVINNFLPFATLLAAANDLMDEHEKTRIKKSAQTKKPKRKARSKQPVAPLLQTETAASATSELAVPQKELRKINESPYDASYILQGEDMATEVIIHDPQYGTVSTLFKTAKKSNIDPKQFIPLKYTNWVAMWFKDPQKALKEQGYMDPKSNKYALESRQQYIIDIHAFARLVDDYIPSLALVGQTPNKKYPKQNDYLITIPGRIQYKNGEQETGIYSYVIDSQNGLCYHRMFEPQSGTKIISDLFEKGYFNPDMTGYYEVFFPPLEKK